MNQEQLNIIHKNGTEWVSSIEIHAKAFSNRRYSNFVNDYLIEDAEIKEGKEYVTGGLQNSGKRGRPVTEYFIEVDYAKEIFASIRTAKSRAYLKYLISLDRKVQNSELLSEDEIIRLVQLKEIFKYIVYQNDVVQIHASKYVEGLKSKLPYAEFHIWRNRMLDIEPQVIEERIKAYCIENRKRINKNASKNEQLLMLDKYQTMRNAVWDFLQIKGEVNSLRLANLVKKMAEAEGTQLFRTNEEDLFRAKEQLVLPKEIQKQLK